MNFKLSLMTIKDFFSYKLYYYSIKVLFASIATEDPVPAAAAITAADKDESKNNSNNAHEGNRQHLQVDFTSPNPSLCIFTLVRSVKDVRRKEGAAFVV